MTFKVRFLEENTTFKAHFGEIQTVGGTGGYQEWYEQGYKVGKTDGEKIGYQNGLKQGETIGYEKGYSDGESSGYNTGHAAGVTIGYQTGYQAGYDKGAEDGRIAGYEEGKTAGEEIGYTQGHTEGYNKGLIDGESIGYEKGHVAGYSQGKIDGRQEGYDEGYLVGESKGYEDGYGIGHSEGYTEGKIDGDTEGYNRGFAEGRAQGYSTGYSEGHDVGYNKGYVDGQENAPNPLEYTTSLRYTYQNAVFPSDYEITLIVPYVVECVGAFYTTSGVKTITFKGNDNGNAVNFYGTFRNCADVESIDFTYFKMIGTDINRAFDGARKLREIKGEIDFTNATNVGYIFNNCIALEEIRFKANSLKLSISFAQSSMLSAQSVQSIIDGLATVETAQTITFHSSIVLTDEQKATISDKGWSLAQ